MKKIVALLLTVAMLVSFCNAFADDTVRISIDEWIGWQNLLDANGGLVTTADSINARNGIYVEYVVMNDAEVSSAALISGELQGAGYTVNRYAFLQDKFDNANLSVVMPYITNYSNGGDGIIAKAGINSVKDLVGKKIAVPRYSEAQTLVEWLLNNSSLPESDRAQIRKDMVYMDTADETAIAFFSGSVDAAATWEPFLTQASSSTDSRVFFSTAMATNLILDGLVFRKDFVDSHEDFVTKLIDGALEARPQYKQVFKNIRRLPMFELMEDHEIVDMANGADLATCQQNCELLSDGAISMYKDMAEVWITIGEVAHPERAETAFTDKYVRLLLEKYPASDEDKKSSFSDEEKAQLMESPEALLTYSADIKFELNSTEIKPSCYEELDEFIKVAKVLDGVYIQIEGNAAKRANGVTDEQIVAFSLERAQSVANYFMKKGIAPERISVVGNGDFKPVNEENLLAPENRRTEFFFKTRMGY